MKGISGKSAGGIENKKRYNGNELQNQEFSDGSGLEVYDFNARTFDPQIGRFIQIDPLSEEGDQEVLSPYHFGKNNPVKYNDPDGKCPSCIIGGIIGAVVDYGTQVAGNLLQGKSLGDALTQVDGTSILISAGAGFVSSGASVFVPKGKVASAVVTTVIDAGESALKQYNETGSVTFSQTVTDVVTNKVAGKITENVSINSNSTIKSTERQLDRAERVAAGDPSSSGRAATVKKLEGKLAVQQGANQAAGQAASGAVSSTFQGVMKAITENKPLPSSVHYNPTDNTSRKPIIVFPIQQ